MRGPSLATRSAEGPMSVPRREAPRSIGAPRILTFMTAHDKLPKALSLRGHARPMGDPRARVGPRAPSRVARRRGVRRVVPPRRARARPRGGERPPRRARREDGRARGGGRLLARAALVRAGARAGVRAGGRARPAL